MSFQNSKNHTLNEAVVKLKMSFFPSIFFCSGSSLTPLKNTNFFMNFGRDTRRLPGPIGGGGSSFFPLADFGGISLPALLLAPPPPRGVDAGREVLPPVKLVKWKYGFYHSKEERNR